MQDASFYRISLSIRTETQRISGLISFIIAWNCEKTIIYYKQIRSMIDLYFFLKEIKLVFRIAPIRFAPYLDGITDV